MNVTVENLPKSQVKIRIEVPAERMKAYEEKASMQISKNIKIPGFRPGHVPADVLKQNISAEALLSHTMDVALPETYTEAVLAQKLQVISRPKIEIITAEPFVYEATVAIYPDVKVEGYETKKIEKKEVKVDEKDVEEVLESILKRRATYKEVEREAKKTDRIEIDFEGFDAGGASLENTKSTNHPLIIGDNTMVPGFEDSLIGLKKGDKKSFKVTFPKDYFHKPFQQKEVEFKVEVKMVEEVTKPEWTPEFIKEVVGEEKPLDELKKMVLENLKEERNHEEKVRRENEFLELIAEKTQVEIPEILIEEEIDAMMEEFKNQLQQMGTQLETYLAHNKKEEKDLRTERGPEAEKRLKLRFGLQQLFKQEKLEVTKDDLQKEIDHIVTMYPEKEQPKVRSEYAENAYAYRRLENKLLMDKLFKKFLS